MSSKKKNQSVDVSNFLVYLFPIGVVVVIAVTMVLILQPQVMAILDERDEVEQKEEQLERLVEKRSELSGMNQEELKNYLAKVSNVIPEEKPVFRLVNGLAALSEQNPGVSVSDYTVNPGSLASESAEIEDIRPGELSRMNTQLQVRGDYESILGYLQQLQLLAPMLGVVRIDVGGAIDPTNQSSGEVNISMDVEAYYSLSPDTLGKASDPLPTYSGNLDDTLAQLQQFTDYYEEDEVQVLDIDQNRQNPFVF